MLSYGRRFIGGGNPDRLRDRPSSRPLRRGLYQLDEHSLATDRRLVGPLRMDETDVVARSTLADPARGEADTLLAQPGHRRGEVVDPESDVVQRRRIDPWPPVGVEGLHQVEFYGLRVRAEPKDVLNHVFGFAGGFSDLGEA